MKIYFQGRSLLMNCTYCSSTWYTPEEYRTEFCPFCKKKIVLVDINPPFSKEHETILLNIVESQSIEIYARAFRFKSFLLESFMEHPKMKEILSKLLDEKISRDLYKHRQLEEAKFQLFCNNLIQNLLLTSSMTEADAVEGLSLLCLGLGKKLEFSKSQSEQKEKKEAVTEEMPLPDSNIDVPEKNEEEKNSKEELDTCDVEEQNPISPELLELLTLPPPDLPEVTVQKTPHPDFTAEERVLFEKALAGDTDAQFDVSIRYSDLNDKYDDLYLEKESLNWLMTAAKKSNIESLCFLGDLYTISILYDIGSKTQLGELLPQDFLKAAQCYSEAIRKGDTLTLCELGILYYRGNGVKQDLNLALKLFNEAKKNDINEALTLLGSWIIGGRGVVQDFDLARNWLNIASNKGDGFADHLLEHLDYIEKYPKRQSPQGDSRDFLIKNGVLKKYRGTSSIVAIPSGIHTIDNSAFAFDSNVMQVLLPNSVKEIKKSAFFQCKKLKSINISGQVSVIGKSAFYNCKDLENVYLSEGIEVIKIDAFTNCTSLEEIWLPNSLKKAEGTVFGGAFGGCRDLRYVREPPHTEFNDLAFDRTKWLKNGKRNR